MMVAADVQVELWESIITLGNQLASFGVLLTFSSTTPATGDGPLYIREAHFSQSFSNNDHGAFEGELDARSSFPHSSLSFLLVTSQNG